MGKSITELKPQAKRDDRVNVYLDGEFGFGLQRSLAHRLRVGQELDRRQIEQLKREDRRARGYRRAASWIARRPRSERELQIGLERQGMQRADVEAVVEWLKRAGLADDLAFARAWIENRMAFRPRGELALRSELKGKGVAARLIDRALEDFDEPQAAQRAATEGARKYRHLSPAIFRRRLSAYLSRRGFNEDTISPLVRDLAVEVETESEEPK